MKSPAFQFYPNDWLSSAQTAMMTPEQEGAYIRLICYDWSCDGIPDDDQILAGLSRLHEGWLGGGSVLVRKCFINHPKKQGFLTNPRIEIERKKQLIWKEKSILGGKRSGLTRLNKAKSKGGCKMVEPNANQEATKGQPKGNSSSSSSSSSSNKTPISPLSETARPESKEQVIAFCESLGLPDGEYFWEKWQGNGFINAGKPMKDWKAVIRSWKAAGHLPSQKQGKLSKPQVDISVPLV